MRIVHSSDTLTYAASGLKSVAVQLDIAILSLQQALRLLDNMDGRKIRMLADALRTRLRQARALSELIERKAAKLDVATDIMEGAERTITALMFGAAIGEAADSRVSFTATTHAPSTARPTPFTFHRHPIPMRRPIPRAAIPGIEILFPSPMQVLPIPLDDARLIVPAWLRLLKV